MPMRWLARAQADWGAGGKLVNSCFTTGDTDFLVISEANEAGSFATCVRTLNMVSKVKR